MRTRFLVSMLAAVLCGLTMPAEACRLFGSYQFVEDKDGGIWFTEGDNNAVSRLAPNGDIKAFPLPTPNAEPSSLALDRRGNLWFVESEGRKIGRLDKDGRIVEYPVEGGMPYFIAVDARGEAWFTQMAGEHDHGGGEHAGHAHPIPGQVGRIDRAGRIHAYPLEEGTPSSIAIDKQDRIWVTISIYGKGEGGESRGKLARLERDGTWKILASWEKGCPSRLRPVPGGRVLFTDGCRHVLAKVTPAGAIRETQLPAGMTIQDMAVGADGRLWYSDRKHIGHFDAKGRPVHAARPDNGDMTFAVLPTRRGDIVFSEGYNYNINRLKKSGEFVEHLVNIDERKVARQVKDGEVCYVQFGARIAAKTEMDKLRADEVKAGTFKPDGAGTEKLVEQKCLACHDARRLLLSRRSDWTPSITRMHAYRDIRKAEPLTAEETTRLVRYFNENYGLAR